MAIKLVIKRHGEASGAPPLLEQSFGGPIITIGSDPASTIRLNGAGVASEQVIVLSEDESHDHLLLINRSEGTLLNNEVLAREARRTLTHGDSLRVGTYVISFILDENSTEAAVTDSPAPRKAPITRELPPLEEVLNPSGETEEEEEAAAPPAPTPPPIQTETTQRSFAEILDTLRTEEDSFYFRVEGGPRSGLRLTIEKQEMLLGWDSTGRDLSINDNQVTAPRAIVRKDWSGVLLQALEMSPGMVAINDVPVEGVQRLHNGDKIAVAPTVALINEQAPILIFHEPASLVVLNTLLPQKLPPPVLPQKKTETEEAATTSAQTALETTPPRPKLFAPERRYFGYFTLIEMLVMIVGTLIAAVIIFLILEYS